MNDLDVLRHWIATNPPLEGRTTGWEPKVLDSEQSAETYVRLGWRVVEYIPADQLQGAVEALRPFAVPDSEFMGEDGIQVCVGITRAEAAAIRAIVGGQ